MKTKSIVLFTFAVFICLSFTNCGLSSGQSVANGKLSSGDPITNGWVSSGGESLIYARNPWFVKNTRSVDYCLQMDEASFSIPKSEVPKLIAEAFQYWKEEFTLNTSGNPRPGLTQIATQTFNYLEKCEDKTPLIFKFGLKNLHPDEIAYLNDPKKYIGVTIRKDYSLNALQGTGIIYITADKGADAYTNNGQLISEAWKSPPLLRYTLIHELGHVFGIPHIGSGIMSEVFMTVLLNKVMAKDFEKISQLSFLNPQKNFEVCRDQGFFHPDFFRLSKATLCLKFQGMNGSVGQWTVFSKQDQTSSYEEIGSVQITALDQSAYGMKPAVIVQLPDEQTVFSALETIIGPFILGATLSETSYTGTFQLKNTIRGIPLQMSLSAEKISFVGTPGTNNQQMTVLTYSPPSFMKAMLP